MEDILATKRVCSFAVRNMICKYPKESLADGKTSKMYLSYILPCRALYKLKTKHYASIQLYCMTKDFLIIKNKEEGEDWVKRFSD